MKLVSGLPEIIIVRGVKLKLQVGDTPATLRAVAKKYKLKYKTVFCLSKNLRGKTDLHGQPYKPTEWVYMQPEPSNN